MEPRFSIKDLLDIDKMKAFDKELRQLASKNKVTTHRLSKQITYKKITQKLKLIQQLRRIGKSVKDIL